MTNPLPLPLSPAPQETWHSYLSRRAAQHGCTLADLTDRLGLRGPRGRWPGYYGVLAPDGAREVARLLGLTTGQVHDMHLHRYDQLALDLSGLRSRRGGIGATRIAVHAAWTWLSGTTYCPQCLAETGGAWRLPWRLPWITSCLAHGTRLQGFCPRCGTTPGMGNQFNSSAPPRPHAAPDGRHCPHHEGGDRCGADLTRAPTRPAPAERLDRTRLFTTLIDTGRGDVAGEDHTCLQALRAWQSGIGIAVRLAVVDSDGWGHSHRWANPPRDPDLLDRLHAAVQPLITATDRAAAADILHGWCTRAGIRSPHADTFTRITQPSAALQPVINELLRRRGRTHTLLQRHLTGPDDTPIGASAWTPRDIPQLVWPCALPPDLRNHRRPDHRILRAAIAMILVRRGCPVDDWATAGTVLGLPGHKARAWTRHAFASPWGLKKRLLDAAADLGAHLDGQPVPDTWQRRPEIHGHGLTAFATAQQPNCRVDDPTCPWCPCTHATGEAR